MMSGATIKVAPPIAPAFEAALCAYREARFKDVLALLGSDEQIVTEPKAFFLYVRVKLRSSPAEAIALLTRNADTLAAWHARAEAVILLGTAHARVGNYRSAHMHFERVREWLEPIAGQEMHRTLCDELQYRVASTLWMERKLDQAESALKALSEKLNSAFYIEALILEGAICAARGRYEEQAVTLQKALAAVLAEHPRNVLHWAHVTAQLSYLAREMPSPSLRDAVFANVSAVPWTDDIADLHFKTLKAAGWRQAIDGDYLSAFRMLKRASRVAPTSAWQVIALCDRADLAQSLGERRFTEQELDDIGEVAERIEWRAIRGEERIALLLLAVLYAPTDGALALSYIARFQETGDRFDGLLSANDDRRLKAMVDYSLGYVYARLKYREDALVFLTDAWRTFSEIGYDWRAARCAKEMATLTRAPMWLARARDKIVHYPKSWIAADVDALADAVAIGERVSTEGGERRPVRDVALTPAQRQVYHLLMDGVAVIEIAKRLERSEFTIRNHIKAIFKAFNVNSRAALMSVPLRSSVSTI